MFLNCGFWFKSPAEITHEQLDGFPQNLVEHGIGSLADSRQFWDEDGAKADVVETVAGIGLLSYLFLCL